MASPRPILFVCASDTLARLLVPVARATERRGHAVAFAKLRFTDEAAEFELGQHIERGRYVGSVRHRTAWLGRYGAIVMGNDWGREARAMILLARRIGVPTICVQESVINLTDAVRRMRHADHALLQGPVSARMLAGLDGARITGNPRYETLIPTPVDPRGDVLLNCNFTYGVEEDNRHAWLASAIAACDTQGRSVTILQHPRDVADLSGYGKAVVRTSASTIHDRLRQGSVVVTRFSSLIHEAIALGRPAIYFNPHHERIGYDFGEECSVLRYARDKGDLERVLADLARNAPSDAAFTAYLREHIRPSEALPSDMCADAITALALPRPDAIGSLSRRAASGDGARRFALLAYAILEQFYLLVRGQL